MPQRMRGDRELATHIRALVCLLRKFDFDNDALFCYEVNLRFFHILLIALPTLLRCVAGHLSNASWK